MGIHGLLPFLEKSSKRTNVKEFAGMTVAVDTYCWLHKGAFSCAEKLVMKEPTRMYVSYCMKYINMLLSHNIKPILVFDGRYLPAKSATEQKRRESRDMNRRKGAELLRAGQVEEGRSHLRRSVDVNHEMALNLMQEARHRNVDCIVAPFEADAQLAYLSITNIAQVIITEDSDLLLFGCEKVLFKMDVNGNGVLIEKDRLHLSMGIRPDLFLFDKFRYMCILSGCDYLASLPGIGLGKACKFLKKTSETDISKALVKLPGYLNMRTLEVTEEYRDSFIAADRTFRCQLVFDPVSRRQVPLTECDADDVVGELLDDRTALDLALGNLDPMSMKRMDSFNPDLPQMQQTSNKVFATARAPHQSIWCKNYTPRKHKPRPSVLDILRPTTAGRTTTANVTLPRKRPSDLTEIPASPSSQELLQYYGQQPKRVCNLYGDSDQNTLSRTQDTSSPAQDTPPTTSTGDPPSPVLLVKNPFAVRSLRKHQRRCGALDRFVVANSTEEDSVYQSRYFSSSCDSPPVSSLSSSLLDSMETADTPSSTSLSLTPPHAVHVDKYNQHCMDSLKSSQEENSSYASNRSDRPYYSPISNAAGTDETVCKETSCFFQTESKSPEAVHKAKKPPPTIRTSITKRPGLSKPKQQTLLSMFKFQPRPKI